MARSAAQSEEGRGYVWRACLPKAKGVRLLLLDVDGVLTDGTIIYTQDGTEIKAFNTKDGLGIRLLQKAGVEVGLLTARRSEALLRRAADLSISLVVQGMRDKAAAFRGILAERHLAAAEVAGMGDDWLDLPMLVQAGFSSAPADAAPEVRAAVHYVTRCPGGRGAVRELADLILEAKGVRDTLLAEYLRK